jgi:CRISPR-associated protein Cmr5
MPADDNIMRTRDQQYAMTAYDRVKEWESKKDQPSAKSYGSMAHTLPILIRTAGLAQALAFVDARKNEAQKKLLDDLAKTIGQKDKDTLLAKAITYPLGDYMRLTQQTMAALLWFKRFAQSILDIDTADETREESIHE